MRLSTYVPYVAALLVAGLGAWGAAYWAVGAIERTTYRAIDLALESKGHGWASVSVDGLQVSLTGTAPSEAERFLALSAAGSIVDSARVIDRMEAQAPEQIETPEFKIEVLRNDDGISLIGLIPASVNRDSVVARIESSAKGLPVADLLDQADYAVPPDWEDAMEFGLTALAMIPRAKISISAGKVDIVAISDSADQRKKFITDLDRARPARITGLTDISAPRPVITPFTLRFVIDTEGPRFDACSSGSVEGRARIVAAAQAAGVTGSIDCTVGMGMPSPRWPEAAVLAIKAVQDLKGGSVTFSDADITLVAPDTTEQSVFDTLVGELETALPDAFSLHAVLPEPVKIDGTGDGEGPPEFVITRSPEGQVQLRGRVPDARARQAAESFAQARFGSLAVHGAMRLDEDLPSGWAARVLTAIEALSYLNNGVVVAQPDFVSVRGVTGEETAKAEISRLLAEKLGERANFEIEVRYEKKLDPKLEIPTPEECVSAINSILNTNKIVFAPGSIDVDAEAGKILDQVAVELRKCEGVAMEIGGHTDSQGRPSMNLQLSQSRADAVLNALLARRVLTSSLTAKGYGETQPVAGNDSDEGREANRRIEFKLLLPEKEAAETPKDPDETAPETDQPNSETTPANE